MKEKKEMEQEGKTKILDSGNVKKLFEHKFIERRVQFIEDYDFKNDSVNRAYFKDFILENKIVRDHWYLGLLIDLAGELRIKNDTLVKRYLHYLNESKHYIIKLSVLDYLMTVKDFDEKYSLCEVLIKASTRTQDLFLVRNQVLLTQIYFCEKTRDEALITLRKNLFRTNDYRSHIRIFNTLRMNDFSKCISIDYVSELIKISKRKSLGRALDEAILDLERVVSRAG